jgi:hypothetical protein
LIGIANAYKKLAEIAEAKLASKPWTIPVVVCGLASAPQLPWRKEWRPPSAGASFYSGCVRNQSLSAFLSTLGQKPVALWDKQHLPAGFRIAHSAGDL